MRRAGLGARVALGLLALGLLAACAASRDPAAAGQQRLESAGIAIDGVVIHNQARHVISDIQLLVPDTGAFVTCGQVFPGAYCATTFPERTYRGQRVQVTWQAEGQPHVIGPGAMAIPAGSIPETLVVEVVITGPGDGGVRLVTSEKR